VREVALDGPAHQDLPFESLSEALEARATLSHSPLFQVMFVFRTQPQRRGPSLTSPLIRGVGGEHGEVRSPSSPCGLGDEGLEAALEYRGRRSLSDRGH